MKNLKIFILLWSICLCGQQKKVALSFQAKYGNDTLVFNKKYEDNISFSTFKCYVSNFSFFNKGKLIHKVENSYFLLNFENYDSLLRTIEIPENIEFDEIHFLLGVDSTKNNEGIGEGELDPSSNMYWTWNTGYINVKLEGFSNFSPIKDHSFQFHLGGFLEENMAAQEIVILTNKFDKIILFIDLKKFMSLIDFKNNHTIMSPGKNAIILSKNLAKVFQNEN